MAALEDIARGPAPCWLASGDPLLDWDLQQHSRWYHAEFLGSLPHRQERYVTQTCDVALEEGWPVNTSIHENISSNLLFGGD